MLQAEAPPPEQILLLLVQVPTAAQTLLRKFAQARVGIWSVQIKWPGLRGLFTVNRFPLSGGVLLIQNCLRRSWLR